jgi:trimeric autotransporter adhesin
MNHRVSRSFYICVLAISGVLCLSYFPLARVRAADTGKPLVNLKSPQSANVTYTGAAEAVKALEGGTANPTALASADFDADGAIDVVAGYSTKNGGLLVVHRGNPDAFAPTDASLRKNALESMVPSTLMPKAKVFAVPESPDLIVTGDFNRDGYKDVLVAARGGAPYLLAGDGRGNLLAAKPVALAGTVTALAVAPDGHVAASVDGVTGPQLVILAPSREGLTAGATFALPARGDSVAWGNLGSGADVAVGAGANLMMVYSALSAKPQTETVSVPFQVRALALGDFIWDRAGRTEISVLADDGSIHILQHGTLDTRPLTAAELPARRAAIRGHHNKTVRTAPDPTALGAWSVAKKLPYTGSAPAGPLSASAFNSPRLAASVTEDLMVIDAGRSQVNILDTSGRAASPQAAISFPGTPVAALALPQKNNGSRDILVLTSGHYAPMLVPAPGDPTFTVTTTADEDDAGACNSTSVTSGTGSDGVLSLREAICEANNNAPSTSTIDIGPGTYDLTSLETGELRVDTSGTGYTLSISGTGTAANTIIRQTDGVDRILEEDYALGAHNPLSISNVTLTGGNCTNTTTNDCGFGGGAILAGGLAGDSLTLTNVVLSNNSTGSTDDGGAVAMEAPDFTVTNCTFSGNTANNETGGGINFVGVAGSAPNEAFGSISITNSTFSNNISVAGGGVYYQVEAPQTAGISGSTFTGNQANGSFPGQGGAVYADSEGVSAASATFSGSRFADNVAGTSATGIAIQGEFYSVTAINNWWGCNAGPGTPANNGPLDNGDIFNSGSPNPGCDSLYLDSYDGASVSTSPWLVLSISASSGSIPEGGTSDLTANLTHNSNGVGGFSVPDGTPVTFGGTLGTPNPTSTSTTSGQATSVFTAGSSTGPGSGTATVDNQEVSTPINVTGTAAFSITKTHTGSFTQGDTADTYTITVTNSGSAATSGTITLTDTLPTGLSLVSFSETGHSGGGTGSDFSCTGLTCTRTTAMAAGEAETFTLTVSVGYNAPTGTNSVTNSAQVSGGGTTGTQTATSPTTINQGPGYVLSTSISPPSSGTVAPNPTNSPSFAAGHYVPGSVVTLTATPGSGYTFSSWSGSGDLSSTSANPTTITMNSATESVTANFTLIPVPPQVVSYSVDFGSDTYNLVGASRTAHLPWTISAITVVFSKPIASANTSSLSGISATGLSGLGTTTLTWTFSGITNATLSTTLAGSGPNAIKDSSGNGLAGGSGFSQAFSVLYGDFNGDGAVTAADLLGVTAATKQPYNLFADINGDGVVNTADATIVKAQEGATQH